MFSRLQVDDSEKRPDREREWEFFRDLITIYIIVHRPLVPTYIYMFLLEEHVIQEPITDGLLRHLIIDRYVYIDFFVRKPDQTYQNNHIKSKLTKTLPMG